MVFTTTSQHVFRYLHHEGAVFLETSANAGCSFCRIISRSLLPFRNTTTQNELKDPGDYDPRISEDQIALTILWHDNDRADGFSGAYIFVYFGTSDQHIASIPIEKVPREWINFSPPVYSY